MNALEHLHRLQGVDIRSLVHLTALLRAGSVSKAADQLGLSQPAMSRTLDRLRQVFGDPLLVRSGNSMVLTARGRQIVPALEELLERLVGMMGEGSFAPATDASQLVIASFDYTQIMLSGRLLPILRREAPRMQVNFQPAAAIYAEHSLEDGRVDVVVGARNKAFENLRSRFLFTDRFACLTRRHDGRPDSLPMDLAEFCAAQHLDVSPSGRRIVGTMIDEHLATLGASRQVTTVLSSYLAAPHVVASTDMICAVPHSIVPYLVVPPNVQVAELAFPPPGIDMFMFWHNVTHLDPARAWLRERVAEVLSDRG